MLRLNSNSPVRSQGYALLEAMLAVAIFALGMLGLGRCISQGLAVESLEVEDTRINRLLQNRAAELEAGAVPPTESQEKIAGLSGGVVLSQTRQDVHKRDERGQELTNLSQVTLEAVWISHGERQSRSLTLYVPTRAQ
jgi:Tfp pilus assembly protein PilV